MATKPILFNTAMVRAILDGRKTQTRRVCKGQPQDGTTSPEALGYEPPYRTGDILWVRETWQYIEESDTDGFYVYAADREDPAEWKWRPSIHMPKEAARLFLHVKAVRLERLQDMSAQDSIDEGVKLHLNGIAGGADPLLPFAELWNSTLNDKEAFSKYCWSANPWVWVIEFERLDGKPVGLWADRGAAQWGDQDVLIPAT